MIVNVPEGCLNDVLRVFGKCLPRTGKFLSGQAKLEQVQSGLVKSAQVKSGQVKSG